MCCCIVCFATCGRCSGGTDLRSKLSKGFNVVPAPETVVCVSEFARFIVGLGVIGVAGDSVVATAVVGCLGIAAGALISGVVNFGAPIVVAGAVLGGSAGTGGIGGLGAAGVAGGVLPASDSVLNGVFAVLLFVFPTGGAVIFGNDDFAGGSGES